MKGLVIKDVCVLSKQMKFFMVLILCMAVADNTFTRGFAVMYATMLPITSIAYDEQSKWPYYAQTMPYKKSDMVFSKYLLGIVSSAFLVLTEAASVAGFAAYRGQPAAETREEFMSIWIIFCTALILMSVNLPVVFRLGAEKGRTVYLLITVVIAAGIVAAAERGYLNQTVSEGILTAGAGLIAAAFLVISVTISVKLYSSRYC